MSVESQMRPAVVSSECPEKNLKKKHRGFFYLFLKYLGGVFFRVFLQLHLKSV